VDVPQSGSNLQKAVEDDLRRQARTAARLDPRIDGATRAQLHANVHNVRVDERSVEATDAGVDKLAHHVGFGERLRPLALGQLTHVDALERTTGAGGAVLHHHHRPK